MELFQNRNNFFAFLLHRSSIECSITFFSIVQFLAYRPANWIKNKQKKWKRSGGGGSYIDSTSIRQLYSYVCYYLIANDIIISSTVKRARHTKYAYADQMKIRRSKKTDRRPRVEKRHRKKNTHSRRNRGVNVSRECFILSRSGEWVTSDSWNCKRNVYTNNVLYTVCLRSNESIDRHRFYSRQDKKKQTERTK